jgi:hypothetical protein
MKRRGMKIEVSLLNNDGHYEVCLDAERNERKKDQEDNSEVAARATSQWYRFRKQVIIAMSGRYAEV